MKRNPFFGAFILAALLVFLFTSCKKEVRSDLSEENLTISTDGSGLTDKSNAGSVSKKRDDLLKSVKQATSRFHSKTQAIRAGYEPSNHCVSSPQGGMGYHWVNPSLVDPVFNPLQPEALLYATGPDGNLRLVALEYIVINVGQPAPMFGSQPFDVGGTPIPAPHWSLHVWLYEHNPAGMFTPFNPNISCP